MNPHGSGRYIMVLWSETISLCKKLKIIYIITCNLMLFCELILSDSSIQ